MATFHTFDFDNGRWVTLIVYRHEDYGIQIDVKDEQDRTIATEKTLTKLPGYFSPTMHEQVAKDMAMALLEKAKCDYDVWRLKIEIHALRYSIDYIRSIPCCNCGNECRCELVWQNAMAHRAETVATIRRLRAQMKALKG